MGWSDRGETQADSILQYFFCGKDNVFFKLWSNWICFVWLKLRLFSILFLFFAFAGRNLQDAQNLINIYNFVWHAFVRSAKIWRASCDPRAACLRPLIVRYLGKRAKYFLKLWSNWILFVWLKLWLFWQYFCPFHLLRSALFLDLKANPLKAANDLTSLLDGRGRDRL